MTAINTSLAVKNIGSNQLLKFFQYGNLGGRRMYQPYQVLRIPKRPIFGYIRRNPPPPRRMDIVYPYGVGGIFVIKIMKILGKNVSKQVF